MVQDTIYKKAYKTHKLDEVSKVLLGYGKYKGISGKDFLTLSPDEQIRYSLEDSKLVMELSKHNDFEVLDALYAISEITGLEFERVCRTNLTTWWGILFDQMIEKRQSEYAKPSKKFAEDRELQETKQKQEEYKGGSVLEPKKGQALRQVLEFCGRSSVLVYVGK